MRWGAARRDAERDGSVRSSLSGRGPVLLVEDEALIAFEAEDLLRDLGADDVTVCWSFEAAEKAVDGVLSGDGDRPGLAVFDLNLNGTLSTPLVERWAEAGGSVVLATGYELEEEFVQRVRGVHLVKPYDERRLRAALEEVIAGRAA